MAEAIDAEGLIKRFGKVTALDGLDLSVRTGEVHGFLGPNGAGKTTTIRILLGLMRHDGRGKTPPHRLPLGPVAPGGGRVNPVGGCPWAQATALHRRLAYVPGDVT